MNIRELFRRKLGNAEITPDPSVRDSLMRNLARREFLRFNPARFNIYYLGGILLAVITSAIILSSGGEKSDKLIPESPYGDITNSGVIKNINAPEEQELVQKPDELIEKQNDLKENPTVRKSVESKSVPDKTKSDRENSFIPPASVNDSFSRKNLFKEASPGMNRLQSGFSDEDVLFEPSSDEGCVPLKLHFNIKTEAYSSCKWTFGDGGFSDEKDPEWIFDVEGDYKVVLTLFGPDGSTKTSSVIIRVHPKPVARFEISPEKALIPEDEIRFYNYSTNAVSYKWEFGDGASSELFEPRHIYSKFDNYNIRLIVTSDHGCSDSLIIMNAFSGSEFYIDFPNAFIPNIQGPTGGYYSSKSDESAEVFHPGFFGVSNYQLKIFSKLGIMIFESNDINIGWDGYLNGQLCEPGVYIWKVRGNFRNGEPFTKMGDLTLLKN